MPVEKRPLMQDYFLVQEKNLLIILKVKYSRQKILNRTRTSSILYTENEPGNLTCVKIFIIKLYAKKQM